jgi:Fe2+ transport system protein FeoA
VSTEEGDPTIGLDELPVGGTGIVGTVEGSPALKQRLMEMGLTAGTSVEVVRFAPLGDPMEIRVRGYYLSLRKADAHVIRLARRAP